jgi:hypothetical protein
LVPFIAFDPADADAIVIDFLVASPTAAAVAPAEPGSPVCSFRNEPAGAVNAVALNMSSHLFTRLLVLSPTVKVTRS